MATVLKINELNPIEKGTVIFQKGKPIRYIGIIVKGSVRIFGGGMQRIAKKGELLALADLFGGQYLSDYLALEDTLLYPFAISNADGLNDFLGSNPEYRGIAVHSMATGFAECLKERERLFGFAGGVCSHFGEDTKENPFAARFLLESDEGKIANYRDSADVLLDVHKKYYYNSSAMAFYQIKEISGIFMDAADSVQRAADYLDDLCRSRTGAGLLEEGAAFGRDEMQSRFFAILKEEGANMAAAVAEEEEILPAEEVMKLLHDSLGQIMRFAGTRSAKQKEVADLFEEFVGAKDRMSVQDDMRKCKKMITACFFNIYEGCFFRWMEEDGVPLAVRMFLHYGYMDERLLDEDQIYFLYERLHDRADDLACQIYTMPEWLREVYEGRKETSRNSFEQDYRDFLREEKKAGKITEAQEKERLEDKAGRVKFELHNMFESNNKIVNGKLSTYVPVLYKDEIYGHMDRLFLSKQRLCDAILELEALDFTIFQREVFYRNPELKIEKEYVLKHVYPDVILAPVYGTASSMWQEITGKRRDTPGRFIFPVMVENEIEKLVMKAFGRFHWEYCRCEQGASWNNIQCRSLTSEYMDYIQYYRKNHELSEEKRQKIKSQILKARNNSREVFLIDYELWMGFEAKGAMKLNKVARLILGTYCPFNKETREALASNAAFAEALASHQKRFGEKQREWDMRIKWRENKNLQIPEEFHDTYHYYTDY